MSLDVQKVSLVFGDGSQQIKALDAVSLKLEPGELMAVLGPSGAGKSSLLAVCGGLLTPTSGKIFINGTEITALKRSRLTEIRREQIGFVFQQSNLVPSLTALDQLLLLVHLRGRRAKSADIERARSLLQEVGVAERANHRPNQLSGGEKQRVGIARAFMMSPALLLVDEPTSMLDQQRGKQIVNLLSRQCHEHNVATLMVTHDHSVLSSADRVVSISDGCVSTNTVALDAA
jgi:putative ABC transport system ATP-binding protein